MTKIPIFNDEISSQAKLYWDIADATILSGYGHLEIETNDRIRGQGSCTMGSVRESGNECPSYASSFDDRPVRAIAIPQVKKSITGMSLLESITADLQGNPL